MRSYNGPMSRANSYEVEVKSLLGTPARAQSIRKAIKKIDPKVALLSRNKQLNHYFVDGDLKKLAKYAAEYLPAEEANRLSDMAKTATDASVRTRDKNGEVFLVVKASVDNTSSSNGIARLEFEENVNMSLEELDALVQKAGYEYQAKWSREREEYKCKGINITLDKNAGYGWLAEFEKVVETKVAIGTSRKAIASLMKKLEVEELPQERLARMFDFYNKNWPEYYGTDKIFTIE
jgi:predicted adenylyl cyclase CyaB